MIHRGRSPCRLPSATFKFSGLPADSAIDGNATAICAVSPILLSIPPPPFIRIGNWETSNSGSLLAVPLADSGDNADVSRSRDGDGKASDGNAVLSLLLIVPHSRPSPAIDLLRVVESMP